MAAIFAFALIASPFALIIFYFIIKAAVRNGIIEASEINNKSDDADSIAQKNCPQCNKEFDIDYPKCPHCK